MRKLLSDKKDVYHLHEYAVLENEDGTYQYMSWYENTKSGKLTWIKGEAKIFGDVLGLMRITSEGEEDAIKTSEEVSDELEGLPKWDRTKYYCVIILDNEAGSLSYCETGSRVREGGEDHKTVTSMLKKHGLTLLFEGAISFEAQYSHLM